MENLTEKQKAIHCTLFKDRSNKFFFTVNVYKPYTTNEGLRAYPVTGQKGSFYTEDVLMTAIYKGSFKRGLTDIIACKKRSTNNKQTNQLTTI